jgi:hypothetical protein
VDLTWNRPSLGKSLVAWGARLLPHVLLIGLPVKLDLWWSPKIGKHGSPEFAYPKWGTIPSEVQICYLC